MQSKEWDSCCCWCKVKNSESKSQPDGASIPLDFVVVAGVKLKILKANHNRLFFVYFRCPVVVAGVKLKILKANHNCCLEEYFTFPVVVAGVKLKILKANHNYRTFLSLGMMLLLLV